MSYIAILSFQTMSSTNYGRIARVRDRAHTDFCIYCRRNQSACTACSNEHSEYINALLQKMHLRSISLRSTESKLFSLFMSMYIVVIYASYFMHARRREERRKAAKDVRSRLGVRTTVNDLNK